MHSSYLWTTGIDSCVGTKFNQLVMLGKNITQLVLVIFYPTHHHKVGYILYQHQKLVNFCPNTRVNTCCSRMRRIHFHERVWEYTGFGTLIGLLNLRTDDCTNIELYDECYNLTSKTRRFPLGTLGKDPIAYAITRTIHMEILLYTPWRSLNSRLI